MKITYIRPNFCDTVSGDAMEPLVFAILASLTPADVEQSLYDDRIEAIPFDEPTDLVAITLETYTAKRAYAIAEEFRKRDVLVVMGGFHPTFLPKEALEHADAVVVGDGEGVWGRIIHDAQNGDLKPIYQQIPPLAFQNIKPDRSIYSNKKYLPISLVQFGRGCKYDCEFCSISAFYKNIPYRRRPVKEVVEEIETIKNNHIFFIDDNLFVNRDRTKELIQALIPLNIRWSCQVSIDIARDDELLGLLKKSGCFNVLIGFESLDKINLEQMKKKWNTKDTDYSTAIEKFYDHGLLVYATFIFGYDNDTVESFEKTVDFAIRAKFFLANFNPLTPMPGAKLYSRLQQENRLIFDKWWLDPDFRYGQALFYPKKITSDQLTDACFSARKRFNKFKSIFSRLLDKRTHLQSLYHLKMYLLANIISHKEIVRKQTMKLG